MDIWGPNNPGFDLNPFTDAEIEFIQDLSSLGDPGANRLLGWDDTDNSFQYFVLGSGLSYDHSTHTLSASGGGGGLSDGDYGDITVSGSATVFTIDNDVVTYAKMQNVSATNRILGRVSGGAGDVEELTAANVRTIINVADGATAYTDELAQDAVGAMVDTTLVYTDGTPLLSRAALTGAITASAGSNSTALGSFTKAELDTAVSDGNILYVGDITQYTDEMAQDAVGGILTDSAEIAFVYTDGGPTITASIVAGSIDEAKLDASVNASLDLADSAAQDLGDLGVTASASELNILDGATLTVTELNYVDGVTSAIQAQLDGKYSTSNPSNYISDLSGFDTDDLAEGSTNLYNQVPAGGSANQVLAKVNGTDYNTAWVTPSSISWSVVTGDTSASVGNGYIANSTDIILFLLPASSAVGDTIKITGINTGGWALRFNSNQYVRFGAALATTSTGLVIGAQNGDSIELVCTVANTAWNIISHVGTIQTR